MFQCI